MGVLFVGLHAITGGVIAELRGGKFGHGFFSAGFTKFATVNMGWDIQGNREFSAIAGRTTVAALIGGTTSALTGGKFANGARTAAMAHLFNAEGGGKKIFNDVTRGVKDGVLSVFRGVGKTVRYLGRSFGAAGDTEFYNARNEGHIMDALISNTVSIAAEHPAQAARLLGNHAQDLAELAKSSANAYTVSRTVSRVVTGIALAPLGALASVGDITYGIEQGRIRFEDQYRHVFYGSDY